MLKGIFQRFGTPPKLALISTALIVNIFVWYFCVFATFRTIVAQMEISQLETFEIWIANFGGATLSALTGATLAVKIKIRKKLLLVSTVLGVFSSLMLATVNTMIPSQILVLSCLLGISFGLGMPACMERFAGSTSTENRARLGGFITFTSFVGTFAFSFVILNAPVFTAALLLATWRGLNLVISFGSTRPENVIKDGGSYLSILSQRSFLLYFIPWIMFSLVNSLSLSVQSGILSETLVEVSTIVENVLVGIFAIVSGFLSDFLGRKRVAIIGFVMSGLGYAVLGIYPENLVSWYVYTVVDGVSGGIFFTVFFMTVWGDLAFGASSIKFYALGGLPYLLSAFLRIVLESYIAQAVPVYAIFSFAAFFLFLAVVPLMYAPETLPEKQIKERELKGYIDKAKKTREKYT